jgi:hypothetical protein
MTETLFKIRPLHFSYPLNVFLMSQWYDSAKDTIIIKHNEENSVHSQRAFCVIYVKRRTVLQALGMP